MTTSRANGSGTATRNKCVVPSGKALFFPLINAFDTEPGFTEQQVWEELEAAFGPITSLHASIDGQAVGIIEVAGTNEALDVARGQRQSPG